MYTCNILIFYVASAILTNGRYPYIYSLAVVAESASNGFTNCHTYYFFHIGSETQNIPVFRLEKNPLKLDFEMSLVNDDQ